MSYFVCSFIPDGELQGWGYTVPNHCYACQWTKLSNHHDICAPATQMSSSNIFMDVSQCMYLRYCPVTHQS